jgi:hypothetical protein
MFGDYIYPELQDFIRQGNNPEDFEGDDELSILIGFYYKKGQYYPKKKADLVAIINSDYVQILRSNYITNCRECSPCFPNQADITSNGDNTFGYTPPPEYIDDYNLKNRIKTIPKTGRVNKIMNELLDEYYSFEKLKAGPPK